MSRRLLAALALTIAVPGVGHMHMGMLVRGAVWLAGNLAVLLILNRGGAATTAVLTGLGLLRAAAIGDLLMMARTHPRRMGDGVGGSGG